MAEQPNFLFFITDQQRADHLGCYGNRVLRTPHVDGIAARGWRFEQFYVANPICMPNRATLMTGRMPTLHGVRHNGIPLALDQTTFVELLRAAGYQTALIGKSHLQNFTREAVKFPHRFEEGKRPPPKDLSDAWHGLLEGDDYNSEQPEDWLAEPAPRVRLPFYGFDHVELCTWHGDMVGGHYLRWLRDKDPAKLAVWGAKHSEVVPGYSAPQARRPRVPPELYPTSYVAERTVAYLEEHARAKRDAPFFIQCSFPDPHHPFTPPGKYWDMYSPRDIELPASFHQPATGLPLVARSHRELADGTANRGWVGVYAVREDEARQIIALTYGMISLIDECIGRVLAALERLGMSRNTVLIFTSDHGDWMADHGLMQKGPLHYRGLIRVPFLWSDPAEKKPGSATSELGGSLDFARTVLDRAGLAPYNGIQGQSLLGIMQRGERSSHDGMIVEQATQRPLLQYDHPIRVRTFVDREWRMTLWPNPDDGELYHLPSDPGEMRNLWHDPAHQAQKHALVYRMLRKTIDLQDWAPLQTQEA